MKIILDRIEINSCGKKIFIFECDDKSIAIHEDNVPKGFSSEARGGDIVECVFDNDTITSATILTDKTKAKREEMKMRLNELFNRRK